jgi:hypothetical protein
MNCAVHPERMGNNLCIRCGNWYCNDCIDYINGQPVCKRCKYGQQNTINYTNPITTIQNLVIQLPREWRIVFTVVYFIVFGILLGCSIYLTLRYRIFLMYIPTAIYLLGGFVFYFLFIRNKIYNKKY